MAYIVQVVTFWRCFWALGGSKRCTLGWRR